MKNLRSNLKQLPEKLINALEKEFGKPLHQIKGRETRRRLRLINARLDQIIQDDAYADYLDPDNFLQEEGLSRIERKENKETVNYEYEGYFSWAIIKRYFHGKTGIPLYKAYALAAYAGMKPHEFAYLTDNSALPQNQLTQMLLGGWDVFMFDSNKKGIKMTPLWLESKSKNSEHFNVHFVAPWKSLYKGSARIADNKTLVFELMTRPEDVPIFICAQIPDVSHIDEDAPIILNAGGLTSGRKTPVIGNLILVKSNRFTERDLHIEQGVNSVSYDNHMHVSSGDKNMSRSFLLNQIIIYLTRHRDNPIRKFQPNLAERLETRNNIYLKSASRTSYRALKDVFGRKKEGYSWYSFSRIAKRAEQIAVFEWKFFPQPERQDIRLKRYRINQKSTRDYEGEVIIQSDHIYMNMQDVNKENSKNFIAELPDAMDEYVRLRGISGTTSLRASNIELKQIGVREILVYMEKLSFVDNHKLQDGYIDSSDFLAINKQYLTHDDKMYLANRDQSVISYPSKFNHHTTYGRRRGVEKYQGNYYVFVRNIYDSEKDDSLYVFPLEISALGQVKAKIHYQQEVQIYNGHIETYARNLIMSLKYLPDVQEKEKLPVFQFDPIVSDYIEEVTLFSGAVIDTNNKHYVGTYPFLMVSQERIPIYSFEPIQAKKNLKIISALDGLMKSHSIKMGDVNSYFFRQNPLARLKEKH